MITFNLVDGRQPHLRILRSWKTSRASSSSRLNQKYLAGGCSIKTAGGEKEREKEKGKEVGGGLFFSRFGSLLALDMGAIKREKKMRKIEREREKIGREERREREATIVLSLT